MYYINYGATLLRKSQYAIAGLRENGEESVFMFFKRVSL